MWLFYVFVKLYMEIGTYGYITRMLLDPVFWYYTKNVWKKSEFLIISFGLIAD